MANAHCAIQSLNNLTRHGRGIVPPENTNMKLYYHQTDGGAKYLMDTYINWKHNGKKGKEGVWNDNTKYVVRIDGDITKDAELTIRDNK